MCDNPCKDYIRGGCGRSECTSNCHQDSGFYLKYNTPEKLENRLKEVKIERDNMIEKHERATLERLQLKYN
jgi:hypothetical protein